MRMRVEKGMMTAHLTVDSSRQESNYLLGLSDIAFVIEQKQLSLCCQSV